MHCVQPANESGLCLHETQGVGNSPSKDNGVGYVTWSQLNGKYPATNEIAGASGSESSQQETLYSEYLADAVLAFKLVAKTRATVASQPEIQSGKWPAKPGLVD